MIMDITAAEPSIDAWDSLIKGLRRFICDGHTSSVTDVTHLVDLVRAAGYVEEMQSGGSSGTERIAEALSQQDHWNCPAAIIEAAVENLRAAGAPPPIVDALYKTQMPAAKMNGRAPDPEPCPGDCMTCCEPFAREELVSCKTANCSYVQCMTCVIKGGGGACTRSGCNQLHMKCPQCREIQALDGQTLADLPNKLLVMTLDNVRERMKNHVEHSAEHLSSTVDALTTQMQGVLDDLLRPGAGQ
jgi:hypothetical protein